MRRGALCRLLWYRCPDCQDVGFAMKPASDAVNSVVETTVGEIRTVAVKV
jgi:hypothetical protein